MIEVGHVDEKYYDTKNISGYINGRIRNHNSRWHRQLAAVKKAA
jgi:hypothetical protein